MIEMTVLDSMTIGEAKELAGMFATKSPPPHPWVVGQKYLIRTATNYLTGKLSFVGEQELVLEDAAWIPDTGRFSHALTTGELSEVEPYGGPAIVGRGAIIDAGLWAYDLPTEVK